MNLEEKQLSSKRIYKGKILSLCVDNVLLPDGNTAERECVRHSSGAAVLLVKDNKALLVKQYRYLYGKEIYEIPAGKLNDGEDAEDGARRELEEETGYRAKLVRYFDLYPSPGYTDEIIYVYYATEYEFVGQKLDEGEFLKCEFIDIDKVLNLIAEGKICDAKTVSAIYKYLTEKNRLSR